MSITTREIGTLVVVVLKANHLPNKRHSKQNPYCVVNLNGEKQRTAAIRKGGQHPEWDQELRFPVFEDMSAEDEQNADGGPPIPPPKDAKAKKPKIKGGMRMKVACYADDPREPDLIGEADVDLTEVYTTGETDEWFELSYKDRFAGKVYLELTFWLHEKPVSVKSKAPKPQAKNYGGPGVFKPSDGDAPQSRHVSTSSVNEGRAEGGSVSSWRSNSSLAGLDLYSPGYEYQPRRAHSVEAVANDFGQLGLNSYNAQEPFPEQSSPGGGDGMPSYPPPTPTNNHRNSMSGSRPSFLAQDPYQGSYDSQPSTISQRPTRGARYSLPAQSSGFVPLQSSSSMIPIPSVRSHTPLPSHPSEPSNFAPQYYNGFPAYSQPPPMPSYSPALPPPPTQHTPSPGPFQPHSSYTYPTYDAPSMPQNLQINTQSISNGPYQGSPSSMPRGPDNSYMPTSARPLPQQPVQHPYLVTANQQISTYNSMGSLNNFQNITPPPPPPPIPESGLSSSPQSYSPPGEHHSPTLLPPPPPAPGSSTSPRPRRNSTLPQPPVNNGNFYPLPNPPHDYLNIGPPPPLPAVPSIPTPDVYNIGPPPPLPAPPVQVGRQWGPRSSQHWG